MGGTFGLLRQTEGIPNLSTNAVPQGSPTRRAPGEVQIEIQFDLINLDKSTWLRTLIGCARSLPCLLTLAIRYKSGAMANAAE